MKMNRIKGRSVSYYDLICFSSGRRILFETDTPGPEKNVDTTVVQSDNKFDERKKADKVESLPPAGEVPGLKEEITVKEGTAPKEEVMIETDPVPKEEIAVKEDTASGEEIMIQKDSASNDEVTVQESTAPMQTEDFSEQEPETPAKDVDSMVELEKMFEKLR